VPKRPKTKRQKSDTGRSLTPPIRLLPGQFSSAPRLHEQSTTWSDREWRNGFIVSLQHVGVYGALREQLSNDRKVQVILDQQRASAPLRRCRDHSLTFPTSPWRSQRAKTNGGSRFISMDAMRR
jgi:hypothetical protein